MRHYLKSFVIATVAFYAAYNLIPTISLGQDPKNVWIVIAAIFLVTQVVRPIFSLVLLPINHLTFGLVSIVLNIALIFALTRFLSGFAISPYDFPGTNLGGLIIPPLKLTLISTTIIVALVITVIQKVLEIVFE